MKIRPKHRELVTHLERFIEPSVIATDCQIEAFIKWESRGQLTDDVDISHLLRAKKNKELTIKMIYEEVFYYWSQCWGWALPLIDIINDENEDRIYKSNCAAIFNTLETRGVQTVLLNHTEFSGRQKQAWIQA